MRRNLMLSDLLQRRRMIQSVAAGSLALATGDFRLGFADSLRTSQAIAVENQRPGTAEWQLDKTKIDPETRYRCPTIEGYCSHTSIRAGQTLRIFVSTNPASTFALDVYRLGYYQGMGARLVKHMSPLDSNTQAEPEIGKNRLRNCDWPVSAEVTIPPDWLSGVYVGKLTSATDGWQSYVIFIVRDDRPADLLFQCSDHTWQAYNRWPSQFSLYDDGENQWHWGDKSQVSFNRPYGKYCQILDQPLSTY